jgi:hypothetical protein
VFTVVELPGSREVWPALSKPLHETGWQTWVLRGRAQDRSSSAARMNTVKWASIVALLAAAGLWSHATPYEVVVKFIAAAGAMVVMFPALHARHYAVATVFAVLALLYNPGVMSAATVPGDLSRYRNFQLGADLPTVARQVGANPSQAKVIHRRPSVIQQLEWRPQSLGPSSRTETAKDVVFSFYDGKLYQIAINYDRYETEGLTADDLIDAISATYGIAAELNAPSKTAQGPYGDEEEVLARWQDSEYCFDLIRSSYGPSFKLVGVLKRLEEPARAAILEAARLDHEEAPQREVERIASEKETERVKLEKSRLVNKPRFRP